jgi:UDP-glucose 4-epimerase
MSASAIVTGASGFLGSAMTSLLLDQGYHVVTIDRNSPPLLSGIYPIVGNLISLDLEACIPAHKYVACFHFAGSSSVPESFVNPINDFMGSVPGTLNLIHFLSKHYPSCRLLVGSSAAVYGNPATLPIKESCPIIPISPYGIHKASIENLCAHYSRLLNFPISILRIFSAYGSGQRKQLLWDTSKKLYEASHSGLGSITMWGTGKETRDFIHAIDIARVALSVAEYHSSQIFDILNVASGQQSQVVDIVNCLCRAWSKDIVPIFGGEARTGDPQQWCADISYLEQFGYIPSISFNEGLLEYASWSRNYLLNH